MNLFILRHGIAADHGTPGIKKDSDRPLTEEGKARTGEIAAAMSKLSLTWDVILSSPYIRARQTAEIVAEKLGLKKKLKLCDALACEGNPKKLIQTINDDYPTAENVLIVGHEPYLSSLISVLVTGGQEAAFTLKKGGFCKLSIPHLHYKKCACLDWLLTPKQLCAMVN